MQALDVQLPQHVRPLGVIATTSSHKTSFSRFITTPHSTESSDLRNYLDSFVDHIGPHTDPPQGDPRRFYRGFDLGWYPIAAELDVRQPIVDDILAEHIAVTPQQQRPSFVVIKGHAGSGKSLVLRRIAWEAATKYGHACFYVSREHLIDIHCFDEIFRLTNLPICLFVDNAADHRHSIPNLIKLAKSRGVDLRVFGAEAYPIWNTACDDLEPLVTHTVDMRYLSETNIRTLVDKLALHDSLGYLVNLTPGERIHELTHVHGRQLLVALLEATHGAPLEEIIANEYRSIPTPAARLLYLDICSLHRFGTPVRAGLIARVHNISFRHFQDNLFKPLEAVVYLREDRRSGDYVYEARHRHIAQTVYDTVVTSTEERFENIVRIMQKLNMSYSYDAEVITKIVRAENLENVLGDPTKVRQVYDVAEEALGQDALVLHQRGIFEMHTTEDLNHLATAEKLFQRAEAKSPYSRAIKHSFSELDLKRSRVTTDNLQRRSWRHSAVARATSLAKGNSPYPHHTLLKAAIDEVKDALEDVEAKQDESTTRRLGDSIVKAEQVLRAGLQQFPNEPILLSEEGQLSSVLSQADRAERAFEKAFSANPRSTLTANRLSRIKRSKGQYADARYVLQRCLEHNPGAQDLHYQLAMVIRESQPDADQIESEIVAHHLRRSFTEGDGNWQAQFWYARQLSVSGKYETARPLFRALAEAPIPYREKKEERGTVRTGNGSPQVFLGRVTRLRGGTFLRCDALNLSAYFSPVDLDPEVAELLVVGDTVRFELAFNLLGPVAKEIHLS